MSTEPWAIHELAQQRGQTLAQMALAWLLKDRQVTSVIIGASRPEQVGNCIECLANSSFESNELEAIERILSGDANGASRLHSRC